MSQGFMNPVWGEIVKNNLTPLQRLIIAIMRGAMHEIQRRNNKNFLDMLDERVDFE